MLTVDYEILGLHAGDRVLDIGCGFGRHSYEALRRGADVVLAEGGPSFNGRRHAAAAFDEFHLSLSPTIAGGSSARIVSGAPDGAVTPMRLARLLEQDGLLFARYVRA